MSAYEMQSVPVTLDKMKMLFWRLDLSKRSFTNLNECSLGVLGLENYRFFKDRGYREKMLNPDDRDLFDRAMTSFKERVPVRAVFRIDSDNRTYWFKLTGWPANDRRYYEGAVEEITEHIGWLKNTFAHQDKRLLSLDNEDYPVALFKGSDYKFVSGNHHFQKLLQLDSSSGKKYKLAELVMGDVKISQVFESLLLDRQLTIEVSLNAFNHPQIKALCHFSYFTHEGEGYIRLAVLDLLNKTSHIVSKKNKQKENRRLAKVCQDLSHCSSIDAMLACIYEARSLFPGMDAVMFSDIYARKNKVIVYSRGEVLDPIEPGSSYPYAGTIAENIEKENLEYLIVDDTQSSIKAIDWMLFVPKGLLSYVAKALYVRGAMRTVLILCSQKKNIFSEDQIDDVTTIAKAFHQQLKQIRKQSKS
ncbi:hypothetical protein [uncultured Desulfuromusa sp.]|uniref:hypothetical protein n=1 Tax=uncultured Desulfuromusa sp. TaxID=219183 RepID=UPI002AA698D4|nr:hypothetical protein [uncultured Desulfuromusa sp.]